MKKIKRKAINRTIKKQRKEFIKKIKNKGRCRTITLKCKSCKRKFRINTTKPDLYTLEVKKNWCCLLCNDKNRKEKK